MHAESQKILMKTEASDLLAFLRENLRALSSDIVPLWHPLGFVSCVIDEMPGNYVARVHYWPNGERRVKNPDWPIHTHSYTLSSLVLDGCVRDLQYRKAEGNDWRVYTVNYFNGGSAISKTGESIGLITDLDELRSAGDQYQVDRGIYHQTQVPASQSAVTLVLLTNHGSEAPKVLGSALESRYPYDRVPFDAHRFWNAVEKAIRNTQLKSYVFSHGE